MIKVLSKIPISFLVILFSNYFSNGQTVNPVSGQLQYSVPVMEVPGPSGSFPINFSYSAGIKPSQESSWIGLGWDFHPGAIFRSVNNVPDDYSFDDNNTFKQPEVYNGSFTYYNNFYTEAMEEYTNDFYEELWYNYYGYFKEHYQNKMRKSPFSMFSGLNGNPPGFENQDKVLDYLGNNPLPTDYLEDDQNIYRVNKAYGILHSRDFKDDNYSHPTNYTVATTTWYKLLKRYKGIKFDMSQFIDNYNPNEDVQHAYEYWGGLVPNYDNYLATSPNFNLSISPYFLGQMDGLDQNELSSYGERRISSYSLKFDYKDENSSSLSKNIDRLNFRVTGNNSNKLVYNETNNEFELKDGLYDINQDALKYSKNVIWFTNNEVQIIESSGQNNSGLMIHPIESDQESNPCCSGSISRTEICFNNESYYEFENETEGYFPTSQNNKGEVPQYDVSDQIGAFMIVDENGFTYHYSLPVYRYAEFQFSRSKEYVGNNDSTTYETYKLQEHPYAYKWELFAITGPNFKDLNNNAQPDEDDLGYWVRFDYGLWTRNRKFRTPKAGFEGEISGNKSGTFLIGKEEDYYLNTLKTRTHTALFVKDIRDDDKGIATFKKYEFSPKSGFGYLERDLFNIDLNFEESKKLYWPTHEIDPGGLVHSNWPVSRLGLSEILLIKNNELDQLLLANGLTDQGLPVLNKLFERSYIVNDAFVHEKYNGNTNCQTFKALSHLARNILDKEDIYGLISDINFTNGHRNANWTEIIPASSLNEIVGQDKFLKKVTLEHTYELAPKSINSFNLNYQNYTFRGYYANQSFTHHAINQHDKLNRTYVSTHLSAFNKGKYTLKRIKTFNNDGLFTGSIGPFYYDIDSLEFDQNGQHIFEVHNGNFQWLNQNKYLVVLNSTYPIEAGNLIKIDLPNSSVYRHFYIDSVSLTIDTLFGNLVDSEVGNLSNNNYNFSLTKNPPENIKLSSNYNDYNPKVISYTLDNESFELSELTVSSSKTLDVWSLHGIENANGSFTKIEYESNDFSSGANQNPKAISSTDVLMGQADLSNPNLNDTWFPIYLEFPNELNLENYFIDENSKQINAIFNLRYDATFSCPSGTNLKEPGDDGYGIVQKHRFLFKDVAFTELSTFGLNPQGNTLNIGSQAIYRTLKNQPNSLIESYHPPFLSNPIEDQICINGSNGSEIGEIYYNASVPEILSGTVFYKSSKNKYYGGGIRVKSIENTMSGESSAISYDYSESNGKSSGKALFISEHAPHIPINVSQFNQNIQDLELSPHYFQHLEALQNTKRTIQSYNSLVQQFPGLVKNKGVLYGKVVENSSTNGIQSNNWVEYQNSTYNKDWDFSYEQIAGKVNIGEFAGLPKKKKTYSNGELVQEEIFEYHHENFMNFSDYYDFVKNNLNGLGIHQEIVRDDRYVSGISAASGAYYLIYTYMPAILKQVSTRNQTNIKSTTEILDFNLLTGLPLKTLNSRNNLLYQITKSVPMYDVKNSSGAAIYPDFGPKLKDYTSLNLLSPVNESHSYLANASQNKISDISLNYNWYYNIAKCIDYKGQISLISSADSIWFPYSTRTFNHENDNLSTKNSDGTYNITKPSLPLNATNVPAFNWGIGGSIVSLFHEKTFIPLENYDSENPGYYVSKRLGYNDKYIVCEANNAMHSEIAFSSAEEFYLEDNTFLSSGVQLEQGVLTDLESHSGEKSISLNSGSKTFKFQTKLTRTNKFKILVWAKYTGSIPPTVVVSVSDESQSRMNINQTGTYSGGEVVFSTPEWKLVEFQFDLNVANKIVDIWIENNSAGTMYLDDFRFQPLDSELNGLVYDIKNDRIEYTLDNSNLYTRFELIVTSNGSIRNTFLETEHGEKLFESVEKSSKNFNK
ncbi:MAG: hypothetical protein RH860_01870 [Cytophagales bacterium]